jgi:gp45 sliding clamp, C terminal
MKLCENTVEILKNFATINQSLLFRAGSVLTTITPTKTVLASAKVVETFPLDFCLYDVNKMLAKLSLYKDSELEFESDRLTFKSPNGKRSDYIKYCSPKVIVTPPTDKKLALDNPEYEFTLEQEDLLWQRKSAGISGSPHMIFRGDGKKIYIQSSDLKDDSSDMSSTEIADTTGVFQYVIKIENWKMLDGSYNVKLSKGLSKFEHKEKSVEYFAAVESALSNY